MLDVSEREEVVGLIRRLGLGAVTAEIVLALGRERITELFWIRELDLRVGREFMEGILGSDENDVMLSSGST